MKINLGVVDTDDLPDNVIVIVRSQGRRSWVILRKGQRTDRPPEPHKTLVKAIGYALQPSAGPTTLIVREFDKAHGEPAR